MPKFSAGPFLAYIVHHKCVCHRNTMMTGVVCVAFRLFVPVHFLLLNSVFQFLFPCVCVHSLGCVQLLRACCYISTIWTVRFWWDWWWLNWFMAIICFDWPPTSMCVLLWFLAWFSFFQPLPFQNLSLGEAPKVTQEICNRAWNRIQIFQLLVPVFKHFFTTYCFSTAFQALRIQNSD